MISNLTLFGIMVSVWFFVTVPVSSFPNKIVPISWKSYISIEYYENQAFHKTKSQKYSFQIVSFKFSSYCIFITSNHKIHRYKMWGLQFITIMTISNVQRIHQVISEELFLLSHFHVKCMKWSKSHNSNEAHQIKMVVQYDHLHIVTNNLLKFEQNLSTSFRSCTHKKVTEEFNA